MTEVLFYHLERQPLEQILPGLIEKTLERGWRAVIQTVTSERVEALDTLLWTYKPDSFLPHGTDTDAGIEPSQHPVCVTTSNENPNQATVRFLVDGAHFTSLEGYTRLVLMFDGRNAVAVAAARNDWKATKAAGGQCTYWQQTAEGRWEKKA
jgi:DNA polymerase III subunit chi